LTVPSDPFICLVEGLIASHAMSDLQKGIAGMPAANTAWAPLFSGKTKDLLKFFDNFKQQVESCALTAC
jgi:hypothetical protein